MRDGLASILLRVIGGWMRSERGAIRVSVPELVVLIGPSGAGKSSVARALGERWGRPVIDTDDEITARIDMPIFEFFGRFGEPAFRAIERDVVAAACRRGPAIIATGGGAVLSEENWAAWRPNSVVVGLAADPSTLVDRVQQQASADGRGAERPLLAGDPEARIRDLLARRAVIYARADVTVDTTDMDPESAIEAVAEAAIRVADAGRIPQVSLSTPSGRSDIYVAEGASEQLGHIIANRWPRSRRVWLVSDENVADSWAGRVAEVIGDAGRSVDVVTVEPGESSKRMSEVERLCRVLTDGGVTRRDVVVALGGGVVGDLAGFVASICLRGLPLVQLPTSLLAMVDSSVGGKTGVNMPAGKNLAGAFYQPGVVVVDPRFLSTLPVAEYRSGMAEIIKHALIQPSTPLGGSDLLETLETTTLDPLPAESIAAVLARNVAIKASVVRADEREAGLRMILNFGHTAGHAIEADGYRYRHGEAIGLGLLTVFAIAERLGRIDLQAAERVRSLLARAGLPTVLDTNIDHVLANLTHDKKNVDGALHWVLPRSEGGVSIEADVPLSVVRDALERLTGSKRQRVL